MPKTDFDGVSSSLYKLEESNRIIFRALINDYHLNSNSANYLNKSFIEVYDIIDTVTENILLNSGGYDSSGVLIGGARKDIGYEVLYKYNFLEKIKNKFNEIEKDIISSGIPKHENAIQDMKSILYPIVSNTWSYDIIKSKTVTELYVDLLIMQNRLLVAEVKYFEEIRGE